VIWLVRSSMLALYPSTDGLVGLDAMDVHAFLVRFRRETTRLMWTGVVVGSLLFAITPLLTVGLPVPAFLLTKAARDRHAHRVSNHRIYLLRQAVFLVKLAAGLCWGADPAIRERFALAPYPDDPGTWRVS